MSSRHNLSGKTAVITGSTRGLGLAMAEAYAVAGAAVVVSSRTPSAVDQTVQRLRSLGFAASGLSCDVGVVEQMKALADHAIAQFGSFDVWVNNAGLSGPYGPTMGLPVKRFEDVVRTNILGTYYGSWVAMKHFLAQGRGKLINVIGAGARKPTPMQSAYGSSKAWVRNFTLALAREYKDSNIGIFAFQPGLVDTDMLRSVEVVPGAEQRLAVFPTIISMWANPPQVPAKKAVWIASSATDGETGLEVRANRTTHFVLGALKEGWRRVTGRYEPVQLTITTIPDTSRS